MNESEHFQKALDKINKNQLEEAIDLLTLAIKYDSFNPFYYNHRAISYLNRKDFELALFDMNKSIELDENYAYFYTCRGFLKVRMGDPEGAINDYERSLELDPENEITYNNLGLVFEQMGNMKGANKMYNKSNQILGYEPSSRNQQISKTEQEEESSTAPNTKNQVKKERQQLAKSVLSNKSSFKEFLSFIRNGFKIQENDQEGKS
jgi:Flp pilus assembly protein TadD